MIRSALRSYRNARKKVLYLRVNIQKRYTTKSNYRKTMRLVCVATLYETISILEYFKHKNLNSDRKNKTKTGIDRLY